MLIKSHFKDYYDVGTKYGIDKSIVFNRHSSYFELAPHEKCSKHNSKLLDKSLFDGPKFPTIPGYIKRSLMRYGLAPFFIGFCGIVYLGIEDNDFYSHNDYYYSSKIFSRYIEKVQIYTSSKRKDITIEQKDMDNLFSLCSNIKISTELFTFLNCPIFYLRFGDLKDEFVTNPCLKYLDFIKVMDPFTAFNEIQYFLSNILVSNDSDSMLKISDESMLYKKGFDKFSFRKDKQLIK